MPIKQNDYANLYIDKNDCILRICTELFARGHVCEKIIRGADTVALICRLGDPLDWQIFLRDFNFDTEDKFIKEI